ncbi:hypothetical protein E3T43_16795 [Cryobacterium sp. Hh7]|uniref:Wadjet anti-phage system protein JetD domain-containing protein n=1 Tax=Cryobacterium sp. Hh7 TaxID=1259159 RepID=UPI00106CB78C|nr:DUF3322 and DUF2220 domain-containing protein [Cryobacterium sp. Hh7]TFD51059.1 hypothetical protein E3T43_16795 [Cryobacterium sp. Hh7]
MKVPRGMVTVAEARERARKRVTQDQRDWAAYGGETALLEIVLHPPTEREALVGQDAAIGWLREWRTADDTVSALEVRWGERHWSRVGAQTVPERCTLRGADAIAAFAGTATARDWRVLRDRAAEVRAAFPGPDSTGEVDLLAAAIRTHARTLQALSDTNFATLLQVVAWLAEHPASGWRIRQLPIRGIDTKWLEGHRAIVEGLHAAVSGRFSLGLQGAPHLVRVRFLDPRLRPGGLCDVIAPVAELAELAVTPMTVFVFENLETMFAMPDLAGAVVVHGGGYAAPRLGAIPWINTGRVIYWGDLDSDGFAILHALRSGCDDVTSTLMDEATLLQFRDLWVPEPKAAGGTYSTLTAGEQTALGRIRSEGNVRLEQERIDWTYALPRLLALAANPS